MESNTIGFEKGIRWLKCVQGAPRSYGTTGAEMKVTRFVNLDVVLEQVLGRSHRVQLRREHDGFR